ncbi:MAG: DUF1559 domain-containing protein [Planctomycetia bacterium]|nr:DUF1559 domain-containing protein [Planctomycetia bacterium]
MCHTVARTIPIPRSAGPTTPTRSGLSLVELLVALAIVAVLTGLLLPAVAAAREAGRQAACHNHLRQVGLALAGFSTVHGRLPTQQRDVWTIDVAADTHGPAIAERLRAASQSGSAATEPAFQADVPLFRCPSDDPGWAGGYPLANIAFNPALLGRRPGQIPDGLARTIQVIEVPSSAGLTWASGPLAFPETVGAVHPRGIGIGLADGSTHWLDRAAPQPMLLALLSPDGCESQEVP